MWNEERVQALRIGWASGLSARQIAAQLGSFEHTADNGRSAVIGKINRLGLSKKKPPQRVALTPGNRPRKPNSVSDRPISQPPKLPVIAYEPIQPGDDVARVLSVLDLEFGQCKWPVPHAGGTGFCGCPAIEGKSWCPGHHARAHESRAPVQKPNYTHPSLRAFG